MSDGQLLIVKGVCSNCAPKIPQQMEGMLKQKLCIKIVLSGQAILLCKECLKMLIRKMEDIEEEETKNAK